MMQLNEQLRELGRRLVLANAAMIPVLARGTHDSHGGRQRPVEELLAQALAEAEAAGRLAGEIRGRLQVESCRLQEK